MSKLLERKFLNNIINSELLSEDDKVIIAISGGPDSIALALLLNEVKERLGISLAIFHLDHKLREDSYKDTEFVRKFSEQLKLDFYSEQYDVKDLAKTTKKSLQDAARHVRYDLLSKTAKRINANKIATGHQANDQIETFFLRLLRGASLSGLRSIPAKRDNIIRPLLKFERKTLLNYLKAKEQPFLTDPSNSKDIYERNKVRSKLMPLLKELNPSYISVFAKNINLINDEEVLMSNLTDKLKPKLFESQNGVIDIDAGKFSGLEKALKRRIIREAILAIKGDLLKIEYNHIETVIENFDNFGFTLELPDNFLIYRDYVSLKIGSKKAFKPHIIDKQCADIGKTIVLSPTNSTFKSLIVKKRVNSSLAVCLDYAKIKPPISLRNRKDGDRFQPLGAKGTKKLQDFMVDKKIPKFSRDSVVLVEDQEKILWVAGWEIDERAKIDNTTEVLIQLTIR